MNMITEDVETAKVGDLLDMLRHAMDVADDLNNALKDIKKRRQHIERQLMAKAEQDGVDSFSNAQISVSLKEDFIAAYEPEQWNELIDWASETGNYQIIQRRIGTKPIKELIDNGSELPAGVRLEPQTKVTVRRK